MEHSKVLDVIISILSNSHNSAWKALIYIFVICIYTPENLNSWQLSNLTTIKKPHITEPYFICSQDICFIYNSPLLLFYVPTSIYIKLLFWKLTHPSPPLPSFPSPFCPLFLTHQTCQSEQDILILRRRAIRIPLFF